MSDREPNITLSGDFDSAVATEGGEAVDLRGSQGPVYKPTGPVRQHFGPALYVPLAGVVLLALALVVAAMVFNIGPLTELLPTPMPFEPAEEGERLIIVADFEDRSNGESQGVDPAQYIYEQLATQVAVDNLDVRVERLYQVVNENTAQSVGDTYSAALLVWGWYDALTVTPRVRWVKVYRSTYESGEGARHLSLVDPAELELTITEDLPNRATYLVMLMLASDQNSYRNYDQALAYVNTALAAATSASSDELDLSEAYFLRGLIYTVQEEYQRALSDYDEVIALHPDDAAAHQNRGYVLLKLGEYERAIEDFNYTLAQWPDLAKSYFTRGLAYKYLGQKEKAIADLQQCLNLSSEEYDWMMRGRAEQHLRELQGEQP